MFPVSWLIQARLAEVATVVDENINGVRVVKSFAAEETSCNKLTAAAQRVEWANIKDADIRARWAPVHREPAPPRAGARAAVRRLPRDQRPRDRRRHRGVQRIRPDAPAAVPPARHDDDDGSAGGGLGAAHLRGARRAARRSSTGPGAVDLDRLPRRRPLRRRVVRLRERDAACCTASTCICGPARPSRWWGGPAPASPRWPACSRGSTTSPAAPSGSTATTCAT